MRQPEAEKKKFPGSRAFFAAQNSLDYPAILPISFFFSEFLLEGLIDATYKNASLFIILIFSLFLA